MKETIILFSIVFYTFGYSQTETHKEKLAELEPDLWQNILDTQNSSSSIKINTVSYNEIPKYLDFKGTVVEALKWTDALGDNILIQIITGHFNWKEYTENKKDYTLQDKAELYAYLFTKSKSANKYTKTWRIYDYIECYGVDWYIGFIPKATTITDIDQNNISEVSIPYISMCRGGMDPGNMKILMYENQTKYALRGATMIMCGNKNAYGGEYTKSKNLAHKPDFEKYLKEHWDRNKCEKGHY